MAATVERIAHLALIRRARGRLDQIEEMRAADELDNLGKSHREIADLLITTQPRVGRLLRGAQTLGDAPNPEELILRATVEGTAPRSPGRRTPGVRLHLHRVRRISPRRFCPGNLVPGRHGSPAGTARRRGVRECLCRSPTANPVAGSMP